MKTGLHLHKAATVDDRKRIIDYYLRSGARVVKFMNFRDLGLMADLKRMGVTIIYRLHTDNQQMGGGAESDFLNKLLANVAGTPIDYAEGYNEAFTGAADLAKFAECEIRRMEALESIGKKAVILNASCGTPDIAHWHLFRPALHHAHARGHALGLHEYAGPYMQYLTRTPDGKNQWNHATRTWTGHSPNADMYWLTTLDGWLTLRYRQVYRLFATWGLGDLPLFITEGGIDDATPRPGPVGRGYKQQSVGEWAQLPGVGGYPEQRRWYMWQASHDRYVKGVVDFGYSGTATGWPDFDMETDPQTMEAVMVAERDLPIGHFGDVPAPQPPPLPPSPPEEAVTSGVDVSRWQGAMDWKKTKAAGVEFAWIKASEGTEWVDTRVAENVLGAAESGIRWGVYHYFRNGMDPVRQAAHFVEVLRSVGGSGRAPGLSCALDFEDTTGRVDPSAMATFAREVERLTGVVPVVYTAAWWWNPARLGGPQAWAARLHLWVADYSGPVSIPTDWTTATVHQWTSSGNGPAHGASSPRIDLNRYGGTLEELHRDVGWKNAGTEPDLPLLMREARENQVIRLNPDGAIQKAILYDGMVPVSDEWTHSPNHQAQLAESLDGSKKVVYVWDRKTGAVNEYRAEQR